MVGHRAVQADAAEPAISEIEVDLVAEPPLGADDMQIADEQHAQHQLGVDRWPSYGAVVWRESPPNEVEVEHRVNAAEQVIGGHVVLKPETKEQRLLPRKPAHDRRALRSAVIAGTNHATNLPASAFFNSLDR